MKYAPLLIFILILFNSFLLHSQTPPASKPSPQPKVNVTLKGQVVDSLDKQAIPYVTLKITESGNPNKVVKVFAADTDGKFNIVLNQAGKFDLYTQYVGKAPSVTPFEVTGNEKTINLGYVNLSDIRLGEVVITAIKPLVAIDLDKITYSMQDDPDSKTSNVLDMLRKVPMITVDGEDKIQLKGSSSYKIYLDGKPSNMISSNPTQVLRSMPANMVKSIEVITDPGAKYDAEGVTGIINIITNKQPMGGYTANLGAGADSRGGYNGSLYATAKYGKIGFSGNYSYNYYRSPNSNYSTYREIYNPVNEKYLYQDGYSGSKSNYQYGSGELSYELDTLNLFTASFSRYGGNSKSNSDYGVEALGAGKNTIYSYNQQTNSKSNYGSTDFNMDYQRTFKKKDELLTASYRLSLSPNDSWSESTIEDANNFPNSWTKQNNNASEKEHTFQLDYTTPLAKIHTLEGGVKYIIRLNDSNTDRNFYDYNTGQWITLPSNTDAFNYRYDILSGYAGYNLRYKDYGFKVGLRAEDTNIKAEYPLEKEQDFGKHYFTLVPSTTVTYRYKMHTFRLGYNLRIQRPGIYYLNPYVNNTDPKYVRSGNPDLDVEKANNINFNYSLFKPKFNLNAGLYYNFVNNSIQSITEIRDDVSYSTYKNIGKRKRVGLDMYFGWTPIKNLRLNINSSYGYMDIRTNNGNGMKNSGFNGYGFLSAQYTLPKDFRFNVSGGGMTPYINLEGKGTSYAYYGLGLNKSFLKKKLTVSLNATSPFNKYINFSSINNKNKDYYSEMHNQYVIQNFSIRISYQFGEMKQQAVKKTQRGISNDDTKSGESSGSSGGSGQPGGGN